MNAPAATETSEDQSPSDRTLEWVTPDDFRVRFTAANMANRLAALIIDTILLLAALIVPFLLLFFTGAFQFTPIIILYILASFLIWNGYWIWYEWRSRGQTYGKYLVGIQVIRAGGGQLKLSSIVTRNILREAEFWMPFRLLLALMFTGLNSGHMFLWTFGLLLIPFFSSENRRFGDYLAGTVVVDAIDDIDLRTDLIESMDEKEAQKQFAFTEDMLEVYGVVQLNALQDVLNEHLFSSRPRANRQEDRRMLVEIKDRIVDKIDYPKEVPDSETPPFLKQFYRSMRTHLENQLASGRLTREEIKEDTTDEERSGKLKRLADQYRLPDWTEQDE